MMYCRRCVLPDTRPHLVIGEDGVCNACLNHGTKESVDWTERESDFWAVVANAKERSRGHDCVIPVSGGKDSTWQVVKCLEYGLRPLCVTWRPPGRTEIGQKNLDNLISLGVDHVDYSINPDTERQFMLKALERFGSTAIPMHLALHMIPLTIAVRFRIPLIVWGENSAFEYGSRDDARTGFALDREWFLEFGVTHGTTAEDWISDDLNASDLASYFSPGPEEISAWGGKAVFLGHYFPWDPQETYRIAKNRGFQPAPEGPRTGKYDFADIDDDFISIHHWLKWYKFGFTRLWDNLALEIRNGRTSRDEVIRVIADRGDETPSADISGLCAFLGITEARFFQIAETFRNGDIWTRNDGAWMIENFLIEDWNWI